MSANEAVSGVLGRDLAALLGDFTGEPAVDLLSVSLDFEDILLVGKPATPFIAGPCVI